LRETSVIRFSLTLEALKDVSERKCSLISCPGVSNRTNMSGEAPFEESGTQRRVTGIPAKLWKRSLIPLPKGSKGENPSPFIYPTVKG
jgi:hypothetical protein